MKNYLQNYIEEIDKLIKDDKITDKVKKNHLIKIEFFQHERLVHLLVTLAYALFMLLTFAFININSLFIFIALILMIFLIFYVKHYFFLENNVQYLYKQYDKMIQK